MKTTERYFPALLLATHYKVALCVGTVRAFLSCHVNSPDSFNSFSFNQLIVTLRIEQEIELESNGSISSQPYFQNSHSLLLLASS